MSKYEIAGCFGMLAGWAITFGSNQAAWKYGQEVAMMSEPEEEEAEEAFEAQEEAAAEEEAESEVVEGEEAVDAEEGAIADDEEFA